MLFVRKTLQRYFAVQLNQDEIQAVQATRLVDNLVGFYKINCLPGINLVRLDEDAGIMETFWFHKARWHDSCRLKYNKTKLQWAEKRTAPHESNACKRVHT